MSELTVELLREKIINLVEQTLEDPNSDLSISLTNRIKNIVDREIETDNEGDIRWDETDELFGEFAYYITEQPTAQPTDPYAPK